MNAHAVAKSLNAAVSDLTECCAINARWVYVNDQATAYYLDAWSVDPSDLGILAEDDGYSHFCAATMASHFEQLSARSKRDAVSALGETARKTDGW